MSEPAAQAEAPRAAPAGRRLSWALAAATLLAILAAGFTLRLWQLNARGLWFDELATYRHARPGLDDPGSLLLSNFNSALYYIGMQTYLSFFPGPVDESVLRFPSVLLGTATIPVVFLIGRSAGSTVSGLFAALVFALHLYAIAYAQEARGYALFMLITALSWLSVVRYTRRASAVVAVIFALLTSLNFYVHYFAAFNFVLQAAAMVGLRRRGLAWRYLLIVALLPTVLCAPIVAIFLTAGGADPANYIGWIHRLDEEKMGRILDLLLGGRRPIAFIFTLALGALLYVASSRRDQWFTARGMLLVWSILGISLMLLVGRLAPIVAPHYLLFLVPGTSAAAGVGLSLLPRWQGLLGATALAAATLYSVLQGDHRLLLARESWREAVHLALAEVGPQDGWLFTTELGHRALEFYSGTTEPRLVADRAIYLLRDSGGIDERYELVGHRPRPDASAPPTEHLTLWALVRDDAEPALGQVRRRLHASGYVERRTELQRVVLYRFTRGPPGPRASAVADRISPNRG